MYPLVDGPKLAPTQVVVRDLEIAHGCGGGSHNHGGRSTERGRGVLVRRCLEEDKTHFLQYESIKQVAYLRHVGVTKSFEAADRSTTEKLGVRKNNIVISEGRERTDRREGVGE